MIRKLSLYTFALLGAFILFNSCKKDYETPQIIDDRKLADFLSQNKIDAKADADKSGYFYVINNPTEGTPYQTTDSVRYNIVIKSLLQGNVYTASPLERNLGTFVGYTGTSIQGRSMPSVTAIMQQLKPGGSARIFLPSYLAWGKNGNNDLKIPSNELIELDITTYKESQAELDDQHIRTFLTKNALSATKDASGVYYMVLSPGETGDAITLISQIGVRYTGRTLDGTAFDTRTDSDVNLVLKDLVPGWQILKRFTKGAKVRIFIPSVLGYGNKSTSSISANSSLDFDIQINSVKNVDGGVPES